MTKLVQIICLGHCFIAARNRKLTPTLRPMQAPRMENAAPFKGGGVLPDRDATVAAEGCEISAEYLL